MLQIRDNQYKSTPVYLPQKTVGSRAKKALILQQKWRIKLQNWPNTHFCNFDQHSTQHTTLNSTPHTQHTAHHHIFLMPRIIYERVLSIIKNLITNIRLYIKIYSYRISYGLRYFENIRTTAHTAPHRICRIIRSMSFSEVKVLQ